jgi:cytidine deaminase
MKIIDHNISYTEYESIAELNPGDRALLSRAKEAIKSAYAPYSAYHVGAAVLLENGKIICGNNQENIAYPSGLCAERVALFYASSKYPDVPVKAIAITAKASGFEINSPIAPCGSCRQVMAETETRFKNKLKIIMMGDKGAVQIMEGVDSILPFMFHADELKKH